MTSCFEKTNFRALETLTIYSNISKTRLLIQITLCRNTRIQMDLSRNNHFSAEKALTYILCTAKKKEGMWNAWVPWVFVIHHASNFIMETEENKYRSISMIPPSSKLELLCQYEMTSLHYIVTKSCTIDDLGIWDPPLVYLFPVQNITENIKI